MPHAANDQFVSEVEHLGSYEFTDFGNDPLVGFQYDASSIAGDSSVRFRIGGVTVGCDSVEPYSVQEESGGLDFNVLEENEYFVIAMTYSEANCRGTKLRQENFRFTMNLIAAPDPPLELTSYLDCPTDHGYEMCLDLNIFPGDVSIFEMARAKWTEKIRGDLPSLSSRNLDTSYACPHGYPDEIDDIYMCGKYMDIDGYGNILGMAGPVYLRRDTLLPVSGIMQYDIADVPDYNGEGGRLAEIIIHEMAHVLGVGTLWESLGLAGSPDDDCPYYGPIANRRFAAMSGCPGATVPLEQEGNEGTRCGHWAEDCFQDEIMTGWLSGVDAPFSRVTLSGLHDLGYRVDYSKGDNFRLDPSCRCDRRELGDFGEGMQPMGIRDRVKRRPKLREFVRQRAQAFGRELLQRRSEARQSQRLSDPEDALFVGDRFVSIIVQDDDGDIFLVPVTP